MILWVIPKPYRSEVILKLGQKSLKFVLLVKKKSQPIDNETLNWEKILGGFYLNFLKVVLNYDVTNAKLGPKIPEFVHYVPTVIEKSKSVII